MTALFFFMIYNFQAGNVRGQPSGVHIERHTHEDRERERESLHRQDPSDYLPDKSSSGFDPLPTSLSVVFVFRQTTVMFS